MPDKTAKNAAGTVVSSASQSETSEALVTSNAELPAESGEPVVSLGLSEGERALLSLRLQKALHAVEMGWDALTKPTDILEKGEPFNIVDGKLIEDFVDKKSGEEKSKCVFVLEFLDGRVVNVMQSAAAPRKVIAQCCEDARALGGRYFSGPWKYVKKGVGQLQDAIIFEQQPGWRQVVDRA